MGLDLKLSGLLELQVTFPSHTGAKTRYPLKGKSDAKYSCTKNLKALITNPLTGQQHFIATPVQTALPRHSFGCVI